MITLKIYRDQLRTVQQNFLPYLERYCEMKVNSSVRILAEHIDCIIIRDLFFQCKEKIDKKLLTKSNRFSLRFSNAAGTTLYKLLMNFPIDKKNDYMIQLRTLVCDIILNQIYKPQ